MPGSVTSVVGTVGCRAYCIPAHSKGCGGTEEKPKGWKQEAKNKLTAIIKLCDAWRM